MVYNDKLISTFHPARGLVIIFPFALDPSLDLSPAMGALVFNENEASKVGQTVQS